eukprot:scaffold4734_cov123-Skeletonema_dohrnii-CCMP3373.AAC.1
MSGCDFLAVFLRSLDLTTMRKAAFAGHICLLLLSASISFSSPFWRFFCTLNLTLIFATWSALSSVKFWILRPSLPRNVMSFAQMALRTDLPLGKSWYSAQLCDFCPYSDKRGPMYLPRIAWLIIHDSIDRKSSLIRSCSITANISTVSGARWTAIFSSSLMFLNIVAAILVLSSSEKGTGKSRNRNSADFLDEVGQYSVPFFTFSTWVR